VAARLEEGLDHVREGAVVVGHQDQGHARSSYHFARAARTEAGFTLVEILLGTVLLALIASSMFAASTLGARGRQRDALRHDALLAAESLRGHLRNYSIAWPAAGEPAEADLKRLDAAMEGVEGCIADCRRIPGDKCAWALALDCAHDASNVLPSRMLGEPRAARMTYKMKAEADGSRTATISVEWKAK
jgi:hypothetical protein